MCPKWTRNPQQNQKKGGTLWESCVPFTQGHFQKEKKKSYNNFSAPITQFG